MRYSEIIKEEPYKVPYAWDEIQAVAEWQNYGSNCDDKLRKVLSSFPTGVKTYSGDCYRIIGLTKDMVKTLLSGGTLKHRGMESWTISFVKANEFFHEIGGNTIEPGTVPVCLKIPSTAATVELNLITLWHSNDWKESLEYWETLQLKGKAKWFNEGLEFEDSQEEIVLSRTHFDLSEVAFVWSNGKFNDDVKQAISDCL